MQLDPQIAIDSPFRSIKREDWKNLNGKVLHSFSPEDLEKLHALNEPLTNQEIEEVYFPLSHLLEIHIDRFQSLHQRTNRFFWQSRKQIALYHWYRGFGCCRKKYDRKSYSVYLACFHPNQRWTW